MWYSTAEAGSIRNNYMNDLSLTLLHLKAQTNWKYCPYIKKNSIACIVRLFWYQIFVYWCMIYEISAKENYPQRISDVIQCDCLIFLLFRSLHVITLSTSELQRSPLLSCLVCLTYSINKLSTYVTTVFHDSAVVDLYVKRQLFLLSFRNNVCFYITGSTYSRFTYLINHLLALLLVKFWYTAHRRSQLND